MPKPVLFTKYLQHHELAEKCSMYTESFDNADMKLIFSILLISRVHSCVTARTWELSCKLSNTTCLNNIVFEILISHIPRILVN